jgi:hypothetical protein
MNDDLSLRARSSKARTDIIYLRFHCRQILLGAVCRMKQFPSDARLGTLATYNQMFLEALRLALRAFLLASTLR